MEFLASLHHKIIHFPIAFLILYPVVELFFLVTKKEFYSKAAFLFLTIGVIGSLFAVLSGNQAFEVIKNIDETSKKLFSEHQSYANLTVWYFTIILIVRFFLHIKKKLTTKIIIIFFILALFGSLFVYQTGNYGGKFAKLKLLQNSNSTFNEK